MPCSLFCCYFNNCGVKVIIRTFLIFVFFESCVFREFRFRTRVSSLTAMFFTVSFEILQISFFSESKFFENACINLFQSDLTSMGKTDSHFQQHCRVWFVSVLYV